MRKPDGNVIELTGFVERDAVRLVVLDACDHVLLLHTRDLSVADFGTAWELPGGGVEPGESFSETAARELNEETGLELACGRLEAPTWHRDVLYAYRGENRLQHERIAVVRFDVAAPDIHASRRVAFESEDHFEHRWWSQDEIVASGERFFPRSLPLNLTRVIAGETVVEALEVWP